MSQYGHNRAHKRAAMLSKSLANQIIIFIFVVVPLLQGSEYVPLRILPGEQTEKPHPTKMMAIFLDDSEHEVFDPVTQSTLEFLSYQVCPILVSQHILLNIITFREYDHQLAQSFEENSEYAQKYSAGQEDQFKKDTFGNDEEKYQLFLKAIAIRSFNPSNWEWFAVNEQLYLLIPHGIKRELTEGLKINTFTRVSYEHLKKISSHIPEKQRATHDNVVAYLEKRTSRPSADYFINALLQDLIFIPNKDYYVQKKSDTIPQWIFFIEGHGELKESIAHLTIEQFKRYISFLENRILTRLLIVSSCYTSGTNVEFVFQEAEKILSPRTVPFPILLEGVSEGDAVTLTPLFLLEQEHHSINIVPHFERQLETLRKILVNPQQTILYHDLTTALAFENVQIRLPNRTQSFALNNNTLEIGTIMAQSRKNPLVISEFFKGRLDSNQPINLLLSARSIPFPIDCRGIKQDIQLISHIPLMHHKNIIHIITKMSFATSDDFHNNVLFSPSKHKIMYIKNIECSDQSFFDVVYDGDSELIYSSQKNTAGEITYYIRKYEQDTVMNDDQKRQYFSLLEKVNTALADIPDHANLVPQPFTLPPSLIIDHEIIKSHKKSLIIEQFIKKTFNETIAEIYLRITPSYVPLTLDFRGWNKMTFIVPSEEQKNQIHTIEHMMFNTFSDFDKSVAFFPTEQAIIYIKTITCSDRILFNVIYDADQECIYWQEKDIKRNQMIYRIKETTSDSSDKMMDENQKQHYLSLLDTVKALENKFEPLLQLASSLQLLAL